MYISYLFHYNDEDCEYTRFRIYKLVGSATIDSLEPSVLD